jgi:hypothetical protein
VGWVSDAWASILKGEKPPPLPGLPEAGKVPSTADPRPTQALGEETSFLSQFAGPPGAAAAKGLGAAALGAAAGKKLLKGAAEEGAEMAGKGIRAYHGSPYDFPKFSSEHIGTGEGAQAYGHGLYFAENPEVAAEYKNKLAPGTVFVDAPHYSLSTAGHDANVRWAGDFLKKTNGDIPKAIALVKETPTLKFPRPGGGLRMQPILDHLEKWQRDGAKATVQTPGKTYEVNIKAEREHFLDWDKPLSEQKHITDKVPELLEAAKKEAYDRALAATDRTRADQLWGMVKDPSKAPAEFALRGLKGNETLLHKAGIPGIKYLDQGSRAEGGTSNFVVFNDALIDIVRKYGIAAIAAIPPALALKNEAASR